GEDCRRHLSRAKDLTTEFDNDRVGLIQAARIFAMLDDVDDLPGNTLGDCFRHVRRPFKLAVELTGGGQNGQFANTSSQSRLMTQIVIEWPGIPRELRTVQQNAAGTSQTSDGPALRVDKAVISTLPHLIQLVASRQRKPAAGLWIDVLRMHRFLLNRS